MIYLLIHHILSVGIDYMPTYIYQIPRLFRYAKYHSVCVLGDFFFYCFVSKVASILLSVMH